MDFLLGLIIFVVLIYLLLRHLGPRLLQWMVRRYLRQADPNAQSRHASRQGWSQQGSSHGQPSKGQTEQSKLNMKDIAKKKFEKDQGEYIDFEEDIHS